MGEGARNPAQQREIEKLEVADAPGNRAAEGKHPQQIHNEVHPPRMHDHVGHERGDCSDISSRELRGCAAVARWDEGKREQKSEVGLIRQEPSDELNASHQGRRSRDAARDIEDGLGVGHG